MLPFFENKEGRENNQAEPDEVVPAEGFAEIQGGKEGENRQGNDFLNGLEFRRAEIAVAHAVGGNLQQIFEKRYAPTDHDGGEQRQRLIAQMPVPRERHEHIGKNQ